MAHKTVADVLPRIEAGEIVPAQELFEAVSDHLFKQGHRSVTYIVDDAGAIMKYTCLYRGENNEKCAAGCLIPDSSYHPDMEEESFHTLCAYARDKECSVTLPPTFTDNIHNEDVMNQLQMVHDNEENWATTQTMREELTEAAKLFSLNTDFLSELSFTDR